MPGTPRETGNFHETAVAGETVRAFVPHPLPPRPPVRFDARLIGLLEKANRALGRLDGLAGRLPEVSLLVYHYIRKEAVLSSQIEGTQSTFNDLLLFESKAAPGVPIEDVEEVSCYVAALQHGLKRMRDGFPLSNRLLREVHKILLTSGRGKNKALGEFRESQNWIGGDRPGNARFVPPPRHKVQECMSALEKFLHDDPEPTPPLIKAGLAHVQFETIHPFLDGNGRLGRMLITLLLCAEGALNAPVLYLSLYFKTERNAYYNWLQEVRTSGDWEGWLAFYLTGVERTAAEATRTAGRILDLFERDAERIQTMGRAAATASRLHQFLRRRPIISIAEAAKASDISFPAATTIIGHFERMKILREITGGQRNKLYAYDAYRKILSEGTAPIK